MELGWAVGLVNLAVAVGMLAVVPTGLGLIGGADPVGDRLAGPGLAWLHRHWLVGAVPGAVSLWLPRGPVATGLAALYALGTVLLAAHAPVRLAARRRPTPQELAVLTALVTPAVAGCSLVAERAGYRLLGFDLEILALTVAHFHYAGFAAALVAGLVCAAAPGDRLAAAAALSVPAGTGVVLLGYFTNDAVELAGAVVLTAGMWLVAWVTWRAVRPSTSDRLTRGLLAVACAVLVVTMLLALDWALGEAVGVPHLPLRWMAATHGLCNAFGFGVCTVLAWRRLRVRPREGVAV